MMRIILHIGGRSMRKILMFLLLIGPCYADISALNIPASEVAVIEAAIKRNGMDTKLRPLLYAIRKSENGNWANGRAFGVLHPKANANPDAQAGWAVCTIQKRYLEWLSTSKKEHFIDFLGAGWAPIGVSNDPNGLNANWVSNVHHYYSIAIQ
jgi:hypothetical protein